MVDMTRRLAFFAFPSLTKLLQGISFFTSITRTDNNGALALLGLYASFGTCLLPWLVSEAEISVSGKRCEATKLYFVFLLLSCVTDFIWMYIYGNQISGRSQQARETAATYLRYRR